MSERAGTSIDPPVSASEGKPSGLHIARLAVDRGGRRIVSDLTFSLAAGECLLLTGHNGTGKTTLLKTIAGLLPTASGTIRLDAGDRELPLAERAHYVGHANGLRSSLTVEENATFWTRYLGAGQRDVTAALEQFGIASLANVPTAYLSAGQKRRLGLSRLLLAQRPLWLLDEPTTSLDVRSTATLTSLIDAHVAAGGLAIIATHVPLDVRHTGELSLNAPPLPAPELI